MHSTLQQCIASILIRSYYIQLQHALLVKTFVKTRLPEKCLYSNLKVTLKKLHKGEKLTLPH